MIRPEKQSPETPVAIQEDQLAPEPDLGITRQVTWFHGELIAQKKWLRTKEVVRLIMDQSTGLPAMSSIDAESIPEVEDPALRYALAFADAADAVGWTPVSPTAMSAHVVMITATDGGTASRLLAVQYTGVGEGGNDSFMQNLLSVAPRSK